MFVDSNYYWRPDYDLLKKLGVGWKLPEAEGGDKRENSMVALLQHPITIQQPQHYDLRELFYDFEHRDRKLDIPPKERLTDNKEKHSTGRTVLVVGRFHIDMLLHQFERHAIPRKFINLPGRKINELKLDESLE